MKNKTVVKNDKKQAQSITSRYTAAGSKSQKIIRLTLIILVLVVVGLGSFVGYLYASSPEAIRHPKLEHAHIRMQVLVNGKPENFGEPKYQTSSANSVCSIAVPPQPIHLHDNKDQFVHLHWKAMSGGLVLKYYGWNLIGGQSNVLGYRFDTMPHIKAVTIHRNVLPAFPKDAQLWVYSGDENGYKARSTQDFLHQDFETFFGTKSTVNANAHVSWLSLLAPEVKAESTATNDGNETHEEKLKRINNLLGNVVVFAQKDKPSDQQVKDRFAKLEPLSESMCGG